MLQWKLHEVPFKIVWLEYKGSYTFITQLTKHTANIAC